MSWLITADLHLTDNPQDEYRWGIFDWLASQARRKRGFLILGDLTNEKDCHPSRLVNKLVAGIDKLRQEGPVYILMGNHDYVDYKEPFFGFLNEMDEVFFIREPQEIDCGIAAIPHQPDQASFDAACHTVFQDIERPRMVLVHGLFDGAISETGKRLTGLNTKAILRYYHGHVFGGDVHTPQQAGLVNYVGAPYRVRFGDRYEGRVIHLDNDSCPHSLRFPCPTKHAVTISDPSALTSNPELKKGDQIKITLELPREEAVHWAKHKQRVLDICHELGLEVFGTALKLPEHTSSTSTRCKTPSAPLTSGQVLEGFCLSEGINGPLEKAGKALLDV